MQQQIISKATKRNWKRLNFDKKIIENKLTSRANKRLSVKKIVPVEYIKNPDNLSCLKRILTFGNIKNIIYTISLKLLSDENLITIKNGQISSQNPFIPEILKEFGIYNFIPGLIDIELPKDERDLLGLIYQMYLSEGTKNKTGSYYTPQKILTGIIQNINPEDKFLDPCCGGGSFLLAASEIIKNPQNLYGCDYDEIACFIAKINLIIRFKNIKFRPNIYNTDFLDSKEILPKFDVVATNPPWGAITNKTEKRCSKESFSCFIIKSSNYLKPSGKMFFVLPEAILNVKIHKDIRQFILNNFHIDKIELHKRAFTAVLSGVITLHLNRIKSQNDITITNGQKRYYIKQNFYEKNTNNIFSIVDNKDVEILKKIYSIPHQTLNQQSFWGIGIVTGSNAQHISKIKTQNAEKIYSGKNITKNNITESENYIIYDRKNFQQCAPDNIYRAKEKLVYKFISKKLVFAYDNNQRLFLNSANILIPKLEGYDIKTVMTFLNSTLFEYIYAKKFNELKVLKGNLMELPFPYLNGTKKITDEKIFEIFKLTKEEIFYIKNEVK